MAGVSHDRSVLAAFQGGEKRLVYARYKDRPGDPLYFLADGTVNDDMRAFTKERLECFMPGCTKRQLGVVDRPRKRDGFMHMPGAGKHGRESLFHEQGKALIARWVGESYPEVQVVVEQATEDRSRRADVMLTWPDLHQMAVEVQYAGLRVRSWRERHESYLRQGISCVWLLGHVGVHLRPSTRQVDRGAGGEVLRTTDLQQEMVEAGVPLLWINPLSEMIGTVHTMQAVKVCEDDGCTYSHDQREFPVAPHEVRVLDRYATFSAHPLAECTLTRSGLSTPALSWLASARADLLTARSEDELAATKHADQLRESARTAGRWGAAASATQQSAPRSSARRYVKALTAVQANRVRSGRCARCGLPRDPDANYDAHWLCGPAR